MEGMTLGSMALLTEPRTPFDKLDIFWGVVESQESKLWSW